MSTISGGSKPEFTGNEVLQASKLNLATHHWVTTEVPDDSVGRDGDIVFVPGDSAPNSELPGIGGWATITEVTGVYNKYTYNDGVTDWVAYEWIDDGTVTTQDGGLMEAAVVAGGGHERPDVTYPSAGDGASVCIGLFDAAKNHNLKVGKAGPTGDSPNTSRGGYSLIEGTAMSSVPGAKHYSSAAGHGALGNASPDLATGNIPGEGVVEWISGQNAICGRGGFIPSSSEKPTNDDTWGCGGSIISGSTVYAATQGVVIIRVPAANAQGVSETRHGWLNFATVENGVVTKVTKTPDNQPYKTAVDEVECDSSVQVGYTYDEETNTFVAPKPDYSDEIAALTERLEELRNV